MGLRDAGRMASGVWTTLVRLSILKRAAGLSACSTGKYDREPVDGTGSWVAQVYVAQRGLAAWACMPKA